MSTSISNQVWSATSEPLHFAWINKISSMLTAVGVLKTSDTGQLDLTGGSVSYPSTFAYSVITLTGYEIRKLSAAGFPDLFLKVTYSVASGNTSAIYAHALLTIQTATGTDGAGNLTGIVGAVTHSTTIGGSWNLPGGSYSPSVLPRPIFMASDGANYLTLLIDPAMEAANYPNTPISQFCIERTITAATGAYNSNGWVEADFMGTSNGWAVVNIPRGLSASAYYVPFKSTGLWSYSNSENPNHYQTFPVTVGMPELQGIPIAVLGAFAKEAAPTSIVKASLYGVTHSYMASALVPARLLDANNGQTIALLRFE